MTKRPDDRLSRPACPHCASGHGDARIVTLKGQARTVTYVCDKCLHEWEVPEEPKSYKP